MFAFFFFYMREGERIALCEKTNGQDPRMYVTFIKEETKSHGRKSRGTLCRLLNKCYILELLEKVGEERERERLSDL